MPKHKPEKTVVCIHHENVVGNIGTCLICGQIREYHQSKSRVLKRGSINGVLTDIHPPEKPLPPKKITERYGARGVREF